MTAPGRHRSLHLYEAEHVTSFGGGPQVEIQLGHICNNRCVFCVSGQLTEERIAAPIDAAPVIAELDRAWARGARKVTFLGGEPTLQRSFLPALRHAVELGYRDIVIFTNGVKARRRSYVEEIVALGEFTWRFSIQGGNEASHDDVVQNEGAFARIVEAMGHLEALGQRITANCCVNERSYRSLPDYVELCRTHGIDQLHIDLIRPSDAGVRTDEYLQSIMTRYSDMVPYFRRMLEGFDAIDPAYDVNVGNLPYCVMPEWAHKIHHDGEITFTVAADGGNRLSTPWNKYEDKRKDKRHPPACESCVFRGQCNGIFDKYEQFYGYDEFQPVTLEQLLASDRGQHHFVLLVEPRLGPLLGDAPPEGWRADRVFRHTRDRFVQARYLDAEGRLATLTFTPPARALPAAQAPSTRFSLADTPDYRLGLDVDAGIDLPALARLLEWVQGHLGVELPVSRTVAALLPRRRLAEGRARIQRAVQGVQRAGWPERWRVAGIDPQRGWPGARVRMTGPDGAAELLLSVRPEGDPEPVRVEIAEADEGTGPAVEACRGVLDRLSRA